MCRLFARLEELNQQFFDEQFFVDFSRSHPAMLYPAIVLQLRLREKIVSEKFWDDQIEKREKKFKGKYVPVKQILRGVRRQESIDEDSEMLMQL
jgi:hypothetical protein